MGADYYLALVEMYGTAMKDLYRVRTKCARLYLRMREAERQRDDLARILKEDKPPLKVGDRVRINWPGAIHHNHIGTVLEVAEVADGVRCKVSRVRVADAVDQWWPAERLEIW